MLFSRETCSYMSKTIVAVTGANGFVGSFLTRALLARGYQVRCLVRDKTAAADLKTAGAELVVGDVTAIDSIRNAVENAHAVFHLAGIRRGTSRAEFMMVNAEGTRNVAEAMVRSAAKRLIYCGSLAATGPSIDGRARVESDPFSPTDWYGESKAEGEHIAFSYSPRIEVTACRPARIIGPLDRENLTFCKLAARGIVLQIRGEPRRVSMIDVDDVVEQLMLQATMPEAVGEAFFCASNEALTLDELMREVCSILKIRGRNIVVPPLVLRAVGEVADRLSNHLGRKLPINRKLVSQLLAPGWICSAEKATRLLQFTARRSVQASLRRSVESYVQAGWL